MFRAMEKKSTYFYSGFLKPICPCACGRSLSTPVLFVFFLLSPYTGKNEALVERRLQEIPLLSLVFVSHFPSYFLSKQTKMFCMKNK